MHDWIRAIPLKKREGGVLKMFWGSRKSSISVVWITIFVWGLAKNS